MRILYGSNNFFNYISKTIIFFVLSILSGTLTYIYTVCIKDLVKPSGTLQIIEFLLKHADDYAVSLLAGTIALVLTIALAITAMWNLVRYMLNDSEDSLFEVIIKILLAIALAILTTIYLKGLFGLAVVAFTAGFIIIGIAKSY